MTERVRRVLVYGVTGSGKTTLARTLGSVTSLPWHSADDEIGWLPSWQERPTEEQRDLARSVAERDAWVLDTAYGKWKDVVLPRVQLVVALDYPRSVSLRRLLCRTAVRLVSRTPVCNGNVETIGKVLSSDSIIWWHFRSFSRKRERIRAMLADPHGPPVVHLRSPAQTRRWLAHVERHGLPQADRP